MTAPSRHPVSSSRKSSKGRRAGKSKASAQRARAAKKAAAKKAAAKRAAAKRAAAKRAAAKRAAAKKAAAQKRAAQRAAARQVADRQAADRKVVDQEIAGRTVIGTGRQNIVGGAVRNAIAQESNSQKNTINEISTKEANREATQAAIVREAASTPATRGESVQPRAGVTVLATVMIALLSQSLPAHATLPTAAELATSISLQVDNNEAFKLEVERAAAWAAKVTLKSEVRAEDAKPKRSWWKAVREIAVGVVAGFMADAIKALLKWIYEHSSILQAIVFFVGKILGF